MQSPYQAPGLILLAALLLLVCITLPSGAVEVPLEAIWIGKQELKRLPASGPAWERLKRHADRPAGSPNLRDQEESNNRIVLAKALVYARTGIASYRNDVIDQCMRAIGTESGGRTLSLARKLVTYVIAADLAGMPPDKDSLFREWLRRPLTEELDGLTLQTTHELRPNNWGTHAGATRAAVAVYLGDREELERTALVFKGWLGDRSAYSGFLYGDVSWQCDPSAPAGINPKGCTKDGHPIGGVLPDDQRRSGPFRWPPPKEGYVYEALQGAVVQAEILRRAGYDTFNWSDQALARAYQWLYEVAQFPAEGDDLALLPIIDRQYGTRLTPHGLLHSAKNVSWTDWTHGF